MTQLPRAAALILAMMSAFACRGETADVQPRNLLELERADAAAFREQILKVDRAFSPEARKLVEQRLAHIENARRPLSPIEFAVEICRLAALADNSHTDCMPASVARASCEARANRPKSQGCQLRKTDFTVPDFNSVPLRFYPFGTDFHVVGVRDVDADLLGARLVAVEGRSMERVLPIVRTFAGGTIALRDLNAAHVLISPDQLHAVGLSRDSDRVTYRLLTVKGQILQRTFAVEPPAKAILKSLPPPDHAPWAFQDGANPFRWRDAPELDALVVQLRINRDAGERKIADFLEQAETTRARLGRANVVLDLRFNDGGDFLTTRDFMVRWPERLAPPGRFFVLTSRRTLSAAMASAAYLEQAGKDRVVLVGEAPGDRLMFFSEGRPVQLPHSGLFVRPATARTDFHTGCEPYDDCFVALAPPGRPAAPLLIEGLNADDIPRMPIAVASLDPHIPAPWTIQSWLDGTDPAIEAIARLRH